MSALASPHCNVNLKPTWRTTRPNSLNDRYPGPCAWRPSVGLSAHRTPYWPRLRIDCSTRSRGSGFLDVAIEKSKLDVLAFGSVRTDCRGSGLGLANLHDRAGADQRGHLHQCFLFDLADAANFWQGSPRSKRQGRDVLAATLF